MVWFLNILKEFFIYRNIYKPDENNIIVYEGLNGRNVVTFTSYETTSYEIIF